MFGNDLRKLGATSLEASGDALVARFDSPHAAQTASSIVRERIEVPSSYGSGSVQLRFEPPIARAGSVVFEDAVAAIAKLDGVKVVETVLPTKLAVLTTDEPTVTRLGALG